MTWVLAIGGRFVAVTSAITLVVFVLLRHFSEPMRHRLLDGLRFLPEHRFVRAERLVNAFVQGAEATRSELSLLLLTIYTILEWVAIAACYLAITRAFGEALQKRRLASGDCISPSVRMSESSFARSRAPTRDRWRHFIPSHTPIYVCEPNVAIFVAIGP